jgi:hypothetical protein
LVFASGAALSVSVAGCTPEIGDKCAVSTDCSIRGDRLCDTSQPGGYCTQLNCSGNGCADEAACVLFDSAIPGCGYDDRSGPRGSRIARSFCMAQCESNGDCRTGYVCADPRTFPWNAIILDDNQAKRTCLAAPIEGQDGGPDAGEVQGSAAVCRATTDAAAPIDASPATIYTPQLPPLVPDAAPAPRDAGTDG